MEDGKVNELTKTYDFFAGKKKDFYSRFRYKSILCQGRHWETPPFVTIIIPTYKRPELLKQALESALNQRGFEDYQILVMDNEASPIEEETSTSKFMAGYRDKKVIYYRNENSMIWDVGVKYARSPWIVFLHDDDLLDENHLAIMTSIVIKHPEIKYLGCPTRPFSSEFKIGKQWKQISIDDCYIQKFMKDAICLGYVPLMLGALISRKHYIAIGGMPSAVYGCCDMAMTARFLNRFGVYQCACDKALYHYRVGKHQDSYILGTQWGRIYINGYYLCKYAINKYHRLTHRVWERNIAYIYLNHCEARNRGIYHAHIDIDYFISECNMPADIKEKNILYYMTKHVFDQYRKFITFLDYLNTEILKRTDVHITVI